MNSIGFVGSHAWTGRATSALAPITVATPRRDRVRLVRLWCSIVASSLTLGQRAGCELPPTPTSRSPRLLVSGGRLRLVELLLERDHAGHEPPFPHLVHLGLEVGEVLVREVREPALPEQVVADGATLGAALGDVLRLPHELQDPIFHLVE